jgi:cytosine/adenosine deaminase-related metal-dependent hydrolase
MEGIFRAIRDSGLRAVAGKCLMDAGEGVPEGLLEDTDHALEEAEAFVRRWDGTEGGLIHGALCPRFILSCSRELWEGTAALAGRLGVPVHTHLLESRAEEEEVRAALGTGQMEFLHGAGVLDTDLRIAHGVWLREPHAEVLAGRALKVVHCPGSNAKLGSGIVHLPFLRSLPNVSVGIGSDGAPCNNDMDILVEMRLAALLQSLEHGPGRTRAEDILALATSEGAKAVGLGDEVGSLEVGKAGDLVVLDLDRPQTFGPEGVSVYDRVVFAAARDAVRWVVVDGEVLVDGGRFLLLDPEEVLRHAAEELHLLLARAELD